MDWTCSGCGRHFNWTVSECPYCKHQTTITTGGTQPTDTQQTHTKIANDIERAMDMLQPGHPPSGVDIDNCRVALHGIIAQLR